ncbi:MAG: hypothetical protein J7L82_02355 [Staphylothermus sp.]|nr:hypothetical protein [Staphylothermus sp.]
MSGKGRAFLAILGVILVAIATLIQMIVDWYQSYAAGIPYPTTIKLLVLAAGVLTFIALFISLRAGGGRRR